MDYLNYLIVYSGGDNGKELFFLMNDRFESRNLVLKCPTESFVLENAEKWMSIKGNFIPFRLKM